MGTKRSEEAQRHTMRRLIRKSDLIREFLLSLVLMLAVCGWSQSLQPLKADEMSQHFDGKWWSKTSADEHSGFLDGADDCLTWTAHKQVWTRNQKGFGGTWSQLNDAIGKFYKDHPELHDLDVVDVWKKVIEQSSQKSVPNSENAETWKNPHWYMDGFWWLDETADQKQGFVEGYLWCMGTQVPAPSETYSKQGSFYVEKIDAFTRANANSKADREKVAFILQRYKD
jgi:hypothetical protein